MVTLSPSLAGGMPAKPVVERPRGFKFHIPHHTLQLGVKNGFMGGVV